MARCPNCSAKLSCSCKLRKAADGKQCCVSCVTQVNKVYKQQQKNNNAQVNIETTARNTAPGEIISIDVVQKE